MDGQLTVAVIGSFRQHNAAVQETCEILRMAGVLVTSPVGVVIIERGIPFVRFTSDDSNWSDPAVQALALHRILRASLTYVVAPGGYVGRTTCYEIGRVLQARKPIYFSERPTDLPILVSDEFILGARTLARLVTCPGWEPTLLHESGQELCCQLERELLNGEFRQD